MSQFTEDHLKNAQCIVDTKIPINQIDFNEFKEFFANYICDKTHREALLSNFLEFQTIYSSI